MANNINPQRHKVLHNRGMVVSSEISDINRMSSCYIGSIKPKMTLTQNLESIYSIAKDWEPMKTGWCRRYKGFNNKQTIKLTITPYCSPWTPKGSVERVHQDHKCKVQFCIVPFKTSATGHRQISNCSTLLHLRGPLIFFSFRGPWSKKRIRITALLNDVEKAIVHSI